MADYTEEIALAKELIDEFGGPATLRVPDDGVSDSSKPWERDNVSDATHPVTVVLEQAGEPGRDRSQQRYIDGTLVEQGDQVVLMAAQDAPATPKLRDELDFSGGRWAIRAIEPLSPDGQSVILWRMAVRK